MTPEELYRYDVNGFMLLKNAIDPEELIRLNKQVDAWEERAWEDFRKKKEGANQEVRYDDVINQEPALVHLAA